MPNIIGNGGLLIPQIPVFDVKLGDIRIDIEPSEVFLLPQIRINAKLDIRFGS